MEKPESNQSAAGMHRLRTGKDLNGLLQEAIPIWGIESKK